MSIIPVNSLLHGLRGNAIRMGASGPEWGTTPRVEDYTLIFNEVQLVWEALNNHTGVVDFKNADFATVFNQASAALTAYGLSFAHTIQGVTCYYAFPPALTIGTPTPGGSVDAGDHFYAVSAVSATGESIVGFEQSVTIGANKTVPLSGIPIGPTGTTQRKIYRTLSTVQGNVGPGPTIANARKPDLSEFFLVGTLSDNTSTTFTDTASDASITGNPAINFAPSFNDGGCIDLARPSAAVSVSGVLHAIARTQTLQMYCQQTVRGWGRGCILQDTTAVSQQYGTLNASILAADGTIVVNETITPPALPFPIGVTFSATGAETMLVTNRMLVSGNQYTYTVQRGYGVPAQAITLGGAAGAVMGSAQGRSGHGGAVDMYHADRTRLEGLAINGNGSAVWGPIHKRTQSIGTAITGGNQSTSYVLLNEFTGNLGPEFSIGLPNDVSATSNIWLMFNRINGKDATGLYVGIGDGHVKFNNISGGSPPIFNNASSVTYLGNHVANTNALFGDWYLTGGQQLHFIGNYVDSIGNGTGAFYRPAGLSSIPAEYQFIGNRYSCSTVTDGVTYIYNFLSQTNGVQIVGEHYYGSAASFKLINNQGGTDWFIDDLVSAATPVALFNGTLPTQIGKCRFGPGKFSENKIAATFSGTGAQTAFVIPHNLAAIPTVVIPAAHSSAAAAALYWTADATNITINYLVAPANGASNVLLSIFCSI